MKGAIFCDLVYFRPDLSSPPLQLKLLWTEQPGAAWLLSNVHLLRLLPRFTILQVSSDSKRPPTQLGVWAGYCVRPFVFPYVHLILRHAFLLKWSPPCEL